MDAGLHMESTLEETLQRVKDENATVLNVEAKTEEILQRLEVEELIRELTVMQ